MKEEKGTACSKQIDLLHHYLEEQITYICVQEEEERMREEELEKKH